MTMRARTCLKTSRSGGANSLVTEMLLDLPFGMLAVIYMSFVARYRRWWVEGMPQWKKLLMLFLAKMKVCSKFTDSRGVTLPSMLSKWCCGALVLLYDEEAKRPQH